MVFHFWSSEHLISRQNKYYPWLLMVFQPNAMAHGILIRHGVLTAGPCWRLLDLGEYFLKVWALLSVSWRLLTSWGLLHWWGAESLEQMYPLLGPWWSQRVGAPTTLSRSVSRSGGALQEQVRCSGDTEVQQQQHRYFECFSESFFKKKNKKKERKKKYIRREYIINCALQTTGDRYMWKERKDHFHRGNQPCWADAMCQALCWVLYGAGFFQ